MHLAGADVSIEIAVCDFVIGRLREGPNLLHSFAEHPFLVGRV
jgi:hypothetical protein